MSEKIICEQCGNPMTYFQEAHTCGWICPVCGDGVATSYFEPILTDIVDYHVILVSADKSLTSIKATPHKDRLTALHAIFRQIFRHFRQNLLEIRQYSCVDFVNLTKNYARNLTHNLCAVLP